MDEDKTEMIKKWMTGRVVINPQTFESSIRCGGRLIPIDMQAGTMSPNEYLLDEIREELWNHCR